MYKNKRTRIMFIITQALFAAILTAFVIVYTVIDRSADPASDRSALVAMLTTGLGLCFCGILFNITEFERHDRRIRTAGILGAVLIVIFLATLLGAFNSFRPLIYIAAGIMLAKIVLTTVHHL